MSLIEVAQSIVGLSAPSDEYLDLIAHGETPERALEMGTMSGCALVWLGLMGRVFVLPERAPYVTGRAFDDVYKVAGGSPWAFGGACRKATVETPPGPGDGMVWGHHGAAVDHVDACVVDATADGDDWLLSVVAGGQRDAYGDESVKLLARTIRWSGGAWVDRSNGRPILAVLDAAVMSDIYPARP